MGTSSVAVREDESNDLTLTISRDRLCVYEGKVWEYNRISNEGGL